VKINKARREEAERQLVNRRIDTVFESVRELVKQVRSDGPERTLALHCIGMAHSAISEFAHDTVVKLRDYKYDEYEVARAMYNAVAPLYSDMTGCDAAPWFSWMREPPKIADVLAEMAAGVIDGLADGDGLPAGKAHEAVNEWMKMDGAACNSVETKGLIVYLLMTTPVAFFCSMIDAVEGTG
jgi:hypothetical protein